DPISDDILRDKDGKAAYIEVLSLDSEAGRAFDAEARARAFRAARKSRTGVADDIDQREENQQKLARLTKGWYLIDPTTREKIEVECTPANALDLYSEAGMSWLFLQVFAEAANPGNFMKRSGSTTSSSSPSTSSEVPSA